MQFPLVGSLSLFSLYLAFRFLEKDLVNLIIGGYFCLVGCLALTATFGPLILAAVGGKNPFLEREFKWGKKFHFPQVLEVVLGPSPFGIDVEFQTLDIFAIVPSGIFVYFYFMTKHWALNNVLGICFCIQGIQRFSLGTYKIGAILLVGLFFYGTPT
jgi:minor histocompatibility antigen H13